LSVKSHIFLHHTICSITRFVLASQEAAFEIFASRQLLTGLDINIKFNSVESFEFTQALSLFDFLDISLFHCWVIGETEPAFDKVKDLSYNQLVVALCEDGDSTPTRGMSEKFTFSKNFSVLHNTVGYA